MKKIVLIVISILLLYACNSSQHFPSSFEEADIYADEMFEPIDSLLVK